MLPRSGFQNDILRCEKSFCGNVRKVFRCFREVFRSFRKFFEAFGRVRTHSDPLGCIWKHLEAFGPFRKFSRFFIFESFFNFSEAMFTKTFVAAQYTVFRVIIERELF